MLMRLLKGIHCDVYISMKKANEKKFKMLLGEEEILGRFWYINGYKNIIQPTKNEIC